MYHEMPVVQAQTFEGEIWHGQENVSQCRIMASVILTPCVVVETIALLVMGYQGTVVGQIPGVDAVDQHLILYALAGME